MSDQPPFISEQKRPDVRLDLDASVCTLTLRELRQMVFESAPNADGDIKFSPDSTSLKNNNKDKSNKEASDLKAQAEHKTNVDKQATDSSASAGASVDSDVIALLRRLVELDEQPAS